MRLNINTLLMFATLFTLTILALVCNGCNVAYGQDSAMFMYWNTLDGKKILVRMDTVQQMKPPKEYLAIALPKYWNEYVTSLKKEFDDELKSEMFLASLRTKKYSVEDEGDKVWIEFIERGYPVCIPIKRRKPTLEGFIEYLRGLK